MITSLQVFLEKVVEGYLFHDLDNIASYIPNNLPCGGAAYPLLSSTCAGIELLGVIANKDAFQSVGQSGDNFRCYWDNYLIKQNNAYTEWRSVVWSLVRCGISHTAFAKPGVLVTKGAPPLHLKPHEQKWIIDASKFYDDFKNSYYNHYRPSVPRLPHMQDKLRQMLKAYEQEAQSVLRAIPANTDSFPTQDENVIINQIPLSAIPASGVENNTGGDLNFTRDVRYD